MSAKDIPTYLMHKPIISADYKVTDEEANAGDARFLSIGKSQWNQEDISAKVFRKVGDDKWSRQSEELPLWRVLDLAKLLIGVITGQQTSLGEVSLSEDDKKILDNFLEENMRLYMPRIEEIRALLAGSQPSTSENKPNIFSFATSELSQDAILAWMLQWADDKFLSSDAELCKLGKSLVSLFTGMPAEDIHQIRVGRQWEHIDVWAEINDDAFLVIEDKTGTTIHDGQLERYKNAVKKQYSGKRDNTFFAYVKTDDEPEGTLNVIRNVGYRTFGRQDLIKALETYKGCETLVRDYLAHLKTIETNSKEYQSKQVKDWGWHGWQGFFKELEKHIEVESWSYVANPSGGFLGLWWHFERNEEDKVNMYLQFEERKLCIKIECSQVENRSEIRNRYFQKLMEVAKSMDIKIDKPARFGAGTYMTVAVANQEDIFPNGQFDLNHLVSQLHKLEALVDQAMK